jgi:hypothetical protein
MMLEARKKYTADKRSREQTGGGPPLNVEYSAVVQEMMAKSGHHYFEGAEGEEGGEVCKIYYFHGTFFLSLVFHSGRPTWCSG